MSSLPLFKSDDQSLSLMQTRWKSQLDPVISNEIVSGQLLPNVSLINGVTIINHKLGRALIGWFVTDQNAVANIYRSKPKNDTTLTLTSDAAVVVSLWVF